MRTEHNPERSRFPNTYNTHNVVGMEEREKKLFYVPNTQYFRWFTAGKKKISHGYCTKLSGNRYLPLVVIVDRMKLSTSTHNRKVRN